MIIFLYANGIANSEDPDQNYGMTAPLIRVCTVCPTYLSGNLGSMGICF